MIGSTFSIVLLACAIPLRAMEDSSILIDCYPDPNASEDGCAKRGCTWDSNVPAQGAPYCHFKTDSNSFAGYDLSQDGASPNGVLNRRNTPSLFGDDIDKLDFQVNAVSDTEVLITIGPSSTSSPSSRKLGDSNLYDVQTTASPFGFAVTRKSTGTVIFDTRTIPGFTFAKQFIQLSSFTPTNRIYGLGEQQHTQLQRQMTWEKFAMFARDRPPQGNLNNLYGSHPFYLGLEPDGNAYGVYLDTTYPLQIALQPDPNVISFLVIGGTVKLHVYLGPQPNTVIQQYVSTIGMPALPPQWGLGFQLSRYGYASLDQAKKVYNRNMAAQIPIETMYFDIDYMDSYKDFTIGQNFAGLSDFATTLHNAKQKMILMVDAAIASNPGSSYVPLSLGLSLDVFLKDGTNTTSPFQGKVWPGLTYFPDFTHPNAVKYWTQVHQTFHSLVSYDGIWNDMNEPSNFDSGSDKGGCSQTKINDPPFNPLFGDALYDKNPCPDAVHSAGLHYELHNVYGHDEIRTTYAALSAVFPGKRPMILTRSSHSGSGKYAAKWTGDVTSSWDQLKWSIIGMLDFNMFGMPFVGADICGFLGDTTQELCVRWHQVGAFYPFSRNHNNKGSNDQDPAVWNQASVAAIKSILDTRVTLIPHLYTLLASANANGSSVARPLFFQWPTDSNTWNLYTQYMWGDSMMFAPILQQGATSRSVYFPAGTWYQYPSGVKVSSTSGGESKTISVAYNETGIFTLNNTIIPIQTPGKNVHESRGNPKGLIISIDDSGRAQGEMYWDDGETLDVRVSGQYANIHFSTNLQENNLQLAIIANSPNSGYWPKLGAVKFDHFVVYGCKQEWFSSPNVAQINGKSQIYEVMFPSKGVAHISMSQGITITGDSEYVIKF